MDLATTINTFVGSILGAVSLFLSGIFGWISDILIGFTVPFT